MSGHPFVPAEIETALEKRYEVGPQIALGGQGAVFRATRTSRPDGEPSDDTVALKLHLYRAQDPSVQREIAAMYNVSNPRLARLIEHGTCDVGGRHTRYIAWEFIEGETLSQRLKGGRLLESEVLTIGRDVAAAIAEVWSQRVVHGDIKPSNIMLRPDGSAVLIDLGAARHIGEGGQRPFRNVSHFASEPSKSLGTVGYLSPEQLRGSKMLSCASDVFSLGVVMLQCLQGWHPTSYNQRALAEGIRASDLRLTVAADLLGVLDRMLLPNPAWRPLPAELASCFQRRYQKIQDDFAKSARVTQMVAV